MILSHDDISICWGWFVNPYKLILNKFYLVIWN